MLARELEDADLEAVLPVSTIDRLRARCVPSFRAAVIERNAAGRAPTTRLASEERILILEQIVS